MASIKAKSCKVDLNLLRTYTRREIQKLRYEFSQCPQIAVEQCPQDGLDLQCISLS
ncbi:hypothetical protein ACP70R_027887 [Stipagrostis hirtigluma subsp. patula]